MNGQLIEFKGNGQSYTGYLSPAPNGGSGVIVVQEWWGLVDHVKDVADRFAAAGFIALAPDFFHGKTAKSPDEAGKLFMALNIADAERVLRGAMEALLSHSACTSKTAGVVGFCMGGQLALYAASKNPDKISACVDFYGIHPNVQPDFQNIKAPILAFFGEKDNSVSPEKVKALSEKLSAAGKQHQFHTYPGASHAFFNDTRPEVYDANAAPDAWNRTLEFLRKYVV
ncbi:dienelactone hydrolase family protein [bacterium]|nr:dienelactone hydrolase family protein [bacterium]